MTAERDSSTYSRNRSSTAAAAEDSALIKRMDVRWASFIAFLAWVFAVYDYILFGTLLPAISETFGWTTSFSTFIATLVAVATFVAALTVGPLMDWVGRAKGLVVVTVGAAISSGLTALTFSAWWLVLVRTFSGWGYSEQAVNATYLNELYASVEDSEERSRKRGRTYSYIQGGWPVGVLFASGMAAALLPLIGWRGVFAIATFPAIVIALLARKLKETPQFTNMREVRRLERDGRHEEARRLSERSGVPLKSAGRRERRLPLLQVFERSQLQHTVFLCLGFLLNWFGVQVFAVLGTTVLLEAHGISLGSSLVVLIVSNAVAFVGYVCHGIIGDKIGRRETIIGGWLLSGIAYALMLFAVDGYAGVFALYTTGLFFLIGPYAALLFYMGESYPTRVRGSGTAMANAMGPIGAILGSALLTGLLSTGFSMGVSALIAGSLTIFLSGICLLGARRVRPGAPLIEEIEATAAA